MYICNTYVCRCKDLPQRPYGMKPTYNMLLSINHHQPLLALYPPSESNPFKSPTKWILLLPHWSTLWTRLRSLCWVPPKRTNRWSCPKLQLMSFWATRTCNPNRYAGLLGAFTKHHHTVYSNFHPLSGDAFLFTTDARQAFDHFPIRVDTSASFADHICVGTISIYQILDQHIFNSHQFTSFK